MGNEAVPVFGGKEMVFMHITPLTSNWFSSGLTFCGALH